MNFVGHDKRNQRRLFARKKKYAIKQNNIRYLKARLRVENVTRWSSFFLVLWSVKRAYDRFVMIQIVCMYKYFIK
jgi:hypothetical protein